MKISNDTNGNRTRGLPACSTVPQPTAPPRASYEGGGSQKFPELLKNHLKYPYKYEFSVTFKPLRLWMQRSQRHSRWWKHCLKPSTEILSWPPGILVELLQRQQNVPPFGYKKVVVVSLNPYSPDLALCDLFLFPGMNQVLKERLLLTLRRFNENRWLPLTAFPLKILGSVSISGSGGGKAASSHGGGALKWTEFSNFYGYFK